MAYIAPKDYAQDPEVVAKIMRTIAGQLDLSWMKNIGERAAFRSAPLDSLHRYAPPGQPAAWQAIPWVRIHKLPEYVRFPHMRHVNAGVTCQTCHGPVQTMNRVYQFASLNMGWCVNCHVQGYNLSDGLRAAGDTAGARAAANEPLRKARYDCSVCHY